MSKGGGCAWCSTHPSSDPPPPGWLATGLVTGPKSCALIGQCIADSLSFEFEQGSYAQSASKAIFRARTYNCITYSVRHVMMIRPT